jgi:hypothetical protein
MSGDLTEMIRVMDFREAWEHRNWMGHAMESPLPPLATPHECSVAKLVVPGCVASSSIEHILCTDRFILAAQ